MTEAMRRLADQAHHSFPVTIYYAFKQSETKGDAGNSSTGWETFLDAVIRAGFALTGTWPIRTEYTGNLKTNRAALASSIVLVSRNRPQDAPLATRREFVTGMKEAGILESRAGKVRLLRPEELPEDWDPAADRRLPVWEVVHHLVRVLESDGETGAGRLVRQLGGVAETARELAYRLYAVAERKNRAAEALFYYGLVQSWPEIARLARQEAPAEQGGLFGNEIDEI